MSGSEASLEIDDGPEGPVGLAVTASVESMAGDLARGGLERRDPAQVGPGGLRSQAFGIVAGGHEQGGRGVDADAIDIEQLGSVSLEEWGDPGVELGNLLVELTDAVGQRRQRRLGCRRHRIG